jgi:hypothetical protein
MNCPTAAGVATQEVFLTFGYALDMENLAKCLQYPSADFDRVGDKIQSKAAPTPAFCAVKYSPPEIAGLPAKLEALTEGCNRAYTPPA